MERELGTTESFAQANRLKETLDQKYRSFRHSFDFYVRFKEAGATYAIGLNVKYILSSDTEKRIMLDSIPAFVEGFFEGAKF